MEEASHYLWADIPVSFLTCYEAFRTGVTRGSAPFWFQLYTVICVRREDNKCLRQSLAPTPPKLAEQSLFPPVYYLFKGSGTGGKLLDWNLFTASSCQPMEGLETALNVLVLMIQVLNFAPSRLLFPVLFNGSGTSLSHALPSSHSVTVSPSSTHLPG